MISRAAARCIVALGIPLLAAACVERKLAPTLDLTDARCVPEPNLSGAHPVPLDPQKPVTITVDAASACLQPAAGVRRSHAVFLLPQSETPYVVSVTSSLRGQTLLSPRLTILDAKGNAVRERARDSFAFRGTSLYAGMRAYPGDRYLLVESDPDTVGQGVTQISGGTQLNSVATGTGGVFFWGRGADATHVMTYAHNGTIVVTARPLPAAN